jgi:hypothetical protein
MNTLILFRSYYGNTKQVAEAMAQRIRSAGHEVQVRDIRLRLPDLKEIDALIIGAPTRIGRVTRKARSVLRHLKRKGYGAKPIAVFDTIAMIPSTPKEMEESRKWLEPGAVGIMQRIARDNGLNLFPDTLRCEVVGMKGPISENAIGKAVAFATAFMSFAQK